MSPADRRFTRILLAVAGPCLIAGGYLAAFTDIGAAMVFLGLGMVAAALVLWTRLPTAVAALAGMLVTAALTLQLVIERSMR